MTGPGCKTAPACPARRVPSVSTPDAEPPGAELPPRNRFGPDLRPLRFAAYRRLFLGGIPPAIGSMITTVAVQQQIFDLTGSNALIGVASLVALIPLVAFGLLGGAIADTYDRRKLLMITSTGIAVCALGLWIQALAHSPSVIVIMALMAIQQGFFAVNQPTRSAVIPRLVPTELVPSANALGFTVFGFAVLGGPLLAGMLLSVTSVAWLYAIEAIAVFAVLYAVFRLPPLPPLERTGKRASVLDGLRFLRTQPLILMTFVVDIIAMVAGMPRALFPDMAEQTFGGQPGGGWQLGLLNAGMAIGTLLGGLTSGWLSRVTRQGAAIVLAILLWGVSVVLFGTTSLIWLAVLYLAVGGWADMVSATYRSSILQTAISDSMRGRMQGVFTVVVAGGPRLADLVHGLAADAWSTRTAVIGGGVLVIVGTVVAALLGPSLWRFDSRSVGRSDGARS